MSLSQRMQVIGYGCLFFFVILALYILVAFMVFLGRVARTVRGYHAARWYATRAVNGLSLDDDQLPRDSAAVLLGRRLRMSHTYGEVDWTPARVQSMSSLVTSELNRTDDDAPLPFTRKCDYSHVHSLVMYGLMAPGPEEIDVLRLPGSNEFWRLAADVSRPVVATGFWTWLWGRGRIYSPVSQPVN